MIHVDQITQHPLYYASIGIEIEKWLRKNSGAVNPTPIIVPVIQPFYQDGKPVDSKVECLVFMQYTEPDKVDLAL
ncbi:MAG: hypothetical protein KAS32_16000 [Candidatus Peribacteraceae bacterium]|nr:hypothetical protein [Candidatus Peribacteraceae bacterium]